MISGRKKRLVLRPGTYWGHTTPTVNMSVIVRRRTRASHSSHALVAKLWSIVSPHPHLTIRGIPESRQETEGGELQTAPCRGFRRAGSARLVVGQLSNE